MLQLPKDQLNVNTPLTSLGVDSHIAIDLRKWLHTHLQVDIPMFKLLDDLSVTQLSAIIVPNLAKEILPIVDKDGSPKEMATNLLTQDHISIHQDGISDEIKPQVKVHNTLETSHLKSQNTASDERNLVAGSESVDFIRALTTTTDNISSMKSISSADKASSIVRKGKVSVGQSSLLFVMDYMRDKSTSNIGIEFTLRGPPGERTFRRCYKYGHCRARDIENYISTGYRFEDLGPGGHGSITIQVGL